MNYSLTSSSENDFEGKRVFNFEMKNKNGKTHFGSGATVRYSSKYKQWVASWPSCSDNMEGMELQYVTISAAMKKARSLNKRYGLV